VPANDMNIELSAIVPMFNEGPDVARFIEALAATLSDLTPDWEIVVVDDGSRDGSIAAVRGVAARCRVRLIRFSRNFGKESALSAGLQAARGRAAVMIDSDFQHPLATIPEFVRCWRAGAHMVYGVRGDRATDPTLRRISSKAFYRVFNWISNIQLESGAGDFRLLDRKVIDAINALPERRRFMKGLYSWVGFETARVVYDVQPRAFGETKWGMGDLGRFAVQGLISFSEKPLRLLAYFGMAFSFPSLLYGAFIAFESLVRGNPVPGWPTIVTAINLSPRQLKHPDFLLIINRLLERYQVEPRMFELEVTESLLLEESERVQNVLATLSHMGFRIALDDFGTGYSSLSYLDRGGGDYPLGRQSRQRVTYDDYGRGCGDQRTASVP
jgi:glycosyltransferase involved in cell wall biosynthesis